MPEDVGDIGILDPQGLNLNPLNGLPYTPTYTKWSSIWSTYPAYYMAADILESVRNNQLLLVISGTGSGKTVLLPKFALHTTGYQGKVAITLPKRVVTLAAASFAATTLDVTLGKEVGYVYKGSPKDMAKSTNRLLYMTDGTLIMKFVTDPTLSEFDVVIIDEAHERKVQIDLLLLFIKRLIASGKRPDIKFIIMSATIDIATYENYFPEAKKKTIQISGQPNYPIETIFLPKPTHSYLTTGVEVISDIIKADNSDILFFITTSKEALNTCRDIRPRFPKVYCIEVYADMDETLKVYAQTRDKFLELGDYNQKLIIATNVAESSITIDGLKYVVDSAHELYSYFDPNYEGQVLEKRLISKAQALQRRGRVGRTEPGICYHLLTEAQYEKLDDYPAPNILKEDITLDLLKIVQITPDHSLSQAVNWLGQLMDPPNKSYIDFAIGLFKLYKLIVDDNISKLGLEVNQFSGLALDRSLFLIYAYQLRCAKEASIIIAMAESLNGRLSNLFHKNDSIQRAGYDSKSSKKLIEKLVMKRGDHLTFLNIYQKFKAANDQKDFAKKYGIRLGVLKNVDRSINKYYYKMLSISRAVKSNPKLANQAGGIDASLTQRLVTALKQSHLHLTARSMTPTYPKRKANADINRDSAVYYYYNNRELAKKTFIYDELTNITGKWEFNMVTII